MSLYVEEVIRSLLDKSIGLISAGSRQLSVLPT